MVIDVDFRDSSGNTPLHVACANDNPDCVRLLLNAAINEVPKIINYCGKSFRLKNDADDISIILLNLSVGFVPKLFLFTFIKVNNYSIKLHTLVEEELHKHHESLERLLYKDAYKYHHTLDDQGPASIIIDIL